MVKNHAHGHDHAACRGCCGPLDRRDFMTTVGLSAMAAPGLFGATTAALAGETSTAPAPAAKPRVRVVYLHPKTDHYWMGWPGACYDIKARDAGFAKIIRDAAAKLDVDVTVDAEPIVDYAGVDKLLAECKQSPPDGMIAVVGTLHPNYWPHADKLAAGKGDVPLVVFSPMGTSFTGHLQGTRKAEKCFVAATQDQDWLATGMKLLRTIWDMKNTRLCIVNGDKTRDEVLPVIGTTLHRVPLTRWTDELAQQEVTDEVRALADELAKTAQEDRRAEPTGHSQRGEELFRRQADHGGGELPGDFAELPGAGHGPENPLPALHGLAEAERRGERRLLRVRLERGHLAAAVCAC